MSYPAGEVEYWRDRVRIAEEIRDDARRECQRLLDEKRALVDGMFSEQDLETLRWLKSRLAEHVGEMPGRARSLLAWLLDEPGSVV